MIYNRKVIKIGSSYGITLPKDYIMEFKVEPGTNIEFISKPNSNVELVIQRQGDDVLSWADKTIERYKEALIELKDK